MANVTLIYSRGLDKRFNPPRMYHEPAQFLGMRASLQRAGHRVAVLDAYGNNWSARQTADQTLATQPDIVGVSGYLGRGTTVLPFNAEVLNRIRDNRPGVTTIIGGPITAHRETLKLAVDAWAPQVAVIGEGEIPMEELSRADFDLNQLSGTSRLIRSSLGGTVTLKARGKTDLDNIDFRRPPEWFKYVLASLDWQRHCLGACKFCAGLRAPATYKSPQRAAEELRYLMDNGKRMFFLIGPDYTAKPEDATLIMDELNRQGVRNVGFAFEACLEAIHETMLDFSRTWSFFGENNTTACFIGEETAVPERLVFLGKVRTLEAARQYLPKLLDLLDKKYPLYFLIAWMLMDHCSTPAAVLFDLLAMIGLLKKYDNLGVNPPSLLNNFTVAPGMAFWGEAAVDWPQQPDFPEPLRKLHAYMEQMQRAGRPGLIGMGVQKIIKAVARSDSPDKPPITKMSRRLNAWVLTMLAKFLVAELPKDQVKSVKSEIAAIAASFEDARVKELIDSQIGII